MMMSFISDKPAPSQPPRGPVDPAALSAQQRKALQLIHDFNLYRTPGGYGRAPRRVTLDLARSLVALGLVRIDHGHREPRPVLTGSGQNTLAVLLARRERRKA